MPGRLKALLAIALLVTVVDQWTKFLAVRYLTPGIADAHFAQSGEPRPDRDTRVRLLSELSLPASIGYFYGTVLETCKPSTAYCPTVPFVDGFWNWRYVENPGAAWGLLASAPEGLRRPFFYAVSLGAIGFILWFFRRIGDGQRLLIVALSLVMGGAIGNFIDRLHLAYVIDFVDWYVGRTHWPTFNFADAAITSGVGLLIVDMFAQPEKTRVSNHD